MDSTERTVLVILGLFKDHKGEFMRIVLLNHDGSLGNGDPQEEFVARSVNRHPGPFFDTVSRKDFNDIMKDSAPPIFEKVNKAFVNNNKIRKPEKIKALLARKRIDINAMHRKFASTLEV